MGLTPEGGMSDDDPTPRPQSDSDPEETREWLDSLEYVLKAKGTDRATYLFERLRDRLGASGAQVSAPLNTPYINTIPAAQEPAYPGNLDGGQRQQAASGHRGTHLDLCLGGYAL
jgi:pyruvate dehydrogenase E1 component